MAHGSENTGDLKAEINRKRAIRRRELARTITHVRNRMGDKKSPLSDFQEERQRIFADTRLNSAFAVPILGMIVAAIASVWIHPLYVCAWFLLLLTSHGVAVFVSQNYVRAQSRKSKKNNWQARFVLADLLYGASWACFFALPCDQDTGANFQVFQFATMLIVIAMNTMQSATLPRSLLVATLPVSLIVAGQMLVDARSMQYTLAAMTIGAQGFFFILGHQLIKNANTVLEYRAEKDHLIAELETANALSDEGRRRAEEANLAKSRFLATMSHELRTPLNAILGFSEVMKDEVLGPMKNATYKGYAADIHSSGAHLLNLINEILDLSRIEAGRHELHEEAVFMQDIAEDCSTMMQIRAKSKEITIHENFEDGLPRVWADERALRQVILNLVSNAVKFTPYKGEIHITLGATRDGGQFVSVRDNGPGIPEEEIPIVLQAFGQGSVAIQSAEPGTGLGLSIVQALVSMHGGIFKLNSKLREGTEAIVTLPKARVLESMPVYDAPQARPQPAHRRRIA
ncbi:MAG: HAMP domain-containing histidine kinase [Rhodobacteraceae bacterium]|nr:HAMP domain-containing histidine kinase [Paracoccaceae bacterium]